MFRKEALQLGIELHEQEIRVVQVRQRANHTCIQKVGQAMMPTESFVHGRILQPNLISQALRRLLDNMGVSTGSATVSISGDCTIIRTIAVPTAPDSEMATIVAGEVDHHHILRTPRGAHAYVRLTSPCTPEERGSSEDFDSWTLDADFWADSRDSKINPDLVTVFAAEEESISAIRQVIEEAGLTVEAVEPSPYAMYRSMIKSAGTAPTMFSLMVGPGNTDIALIYKGSLVAYRRIDVGSRALRSTPNGPYTYGGLETQEHIHRAHPDDRAVQAPSLNRSALDEFATEIRRTLYYYEREYPSLALGDRIVLGIDDSDLASLAEELGQRLGVAVESARPVGSPQDEPEAAGALGQPGASALTTAYGLAIQDTVVGKVSKVDLFCIERSDVETREAKKNFRGSIVTSAAAVFLGLIGTMMYESQISTIQADTKRTAARAEQARLATDSKLGERHRQAEQYKAFSREGIPVTAILDSIAHSIGAGTGLASVSVSPAKVVTIGGEAENETSMIRTMKSLEQCPLLEDVRIIGFRQVPPEKGSGISFEFSGKTVSTDQIKVQKVASL